MHLTRILAAASALALAAAALAAVPAHAATSAHYVALGDSYSSGVGAGGTVSGGSCDRSTNAFPALYDAKTGPAAYAFVACGGATTATVQSSQLSSLSSATSLVSITVGGNDVGFSSIIETCVLGSTASCTTAVDKAETYARTTLPGLLDTTYGKIKTDAPHAKVVVLDYPDFYDLAPSTCVGLSRTDHVDLDAGIDVLDGVISAAASRAKLTFADVRSAFAGHEICDGGTKWLHALNYTDIDESYHPTADGQSMAYEPVFAKAAA